MITAFILNIMAAPVSGKIVRQFVVEIKQDVHNNYTPQERNINLALEAFVNYKDNMMKDWTFLLFRDGIRLGQNIELPLEATDELMKRATRESESFRVRDIIIYEKVKTDLFFEPSLGRYFAEEIDFLSAAKSRNVIIAPTAKDALELADSMNGWDYDWV